MKMNDFIEEVEKSYMKNFPESSCFVRYNGNLWRSISIDCKIAKNIDEVANRIWMNDMLHISFSIATDKGQLPKGIEESSELPENLMLEVERKFYMIKPIASEPYVAYSSRSLSFRKTKGNAEKIIKTLDKYFKTLREQLEKDLSDGAISDSHIELLKSKLV